MNELEFKRELQESLSKAAVPVSLYRFAREVPNLCDGEGAAPANKRENRRVRYKFLSFASKSAAALAILAGAWSAGVSMSPAFAAYMKEIPGFSVAVDWLSGLRERDGVQAAIRNGYVPIEARSAQFGGTTVTIGDVYLTDEELLYKAFIRSDEYDLTDARSHVHINVVPANIQGGGSNTGSSLTATTDGEQAPVLQVSYKFQLEEHAVREFMAREKELVFDVTKVTAHPEARRVDRMSLGTISVPVDPDKLLHNRVYEPRQALPLGVPDPDWTSLTLNKLTIQPTTMNAVLYGKEGWELEFPREEGTAPYLKDEKGNVYRYDPSGPILLLKDGQIQLPFSSSVFFERGVESLQLHIGTVRVTERNPSGSFELSKGETFPKVVPFKNKRIVIEGAEFKDGYIHLKIQKEYPGQQILEGVRFYIPDYYDQLAMKKELGKRADALREQLGIDGWERAESSRDDSSSLDLYIPAPDQERVTIALQRVRDPISVNQEYTIRID
ncbi:DUF4179 domain-containing protein [Paenibacillus thermoaerophilus]|uniref:DUF4179 domain-containing protein n=1 Tax=Paenibacillus thermoaerophilus TaxID=1215385 RepID=A0ABW2V202_9BACL|nr:DUF4179 domain-containing protein [Paenibacillus thermoaerophilus]TMV08105.1 DUF4179 domain-containing protein [Paenibacillus thermoaerophilus]